MRIRLTIGSPGRECDALVTAPPGTTLTAIAAGLCALVGRPPGELYVGSTVLAADTKLGGPGLRDGSRLQVGGPGPREPARGLVELRVLSGHDAGQRWALHRGEHVIGRGRACGLRLTDPHCSGRHVLLLAGSSGVTVRDLGSVNGSTLDGHRLGADPQPLQPGRRLRVGDTLLGLAAADEPPAVTRAGGDGGRQVVRPPRLHPPSSPVTIDWPAEPEVRPPARLALLAVGAPLILGVTLALVLDRPQFLLFALLSPLMLLGTWLSDRRHRRRSRGGDLRAHTADVARAEAARDAALTADRRACLRSTPDLAIVGAVARGPGQRLWERRPGDPDFGTVRVGTGCRPTGVSVRGTGGTTNLWAADRPLVLALPALGVVGCAGPPGPLHELVRGVVVQLAVWHSPRDLTLVLVLPPGEPAADWAWLRWLPHLRRAPPLPELAAAIAERPASTRDVVPDTVLLLPASDRLRADPAVGRLLASGPRVGVLALCLAPQARRLPVECRAVVTVTGDTGGRVTLASSDQTVGPTDGSLDGLSAGRADRIARDLAPLRDAGGRGDDPPTRVRLLDLLGLVEPDPAAIGAAWATSDGTPRTPLGHDGRGRFVVDLVRDGPHTLVAGTTGAGKSQLLQTLVAGLAAGTPPSALQFVLVDYKGGAAFRDCSRLPHTSGLVTDLDAHLTARALRSLRAELSRRERILAAAGAPDLATYLSEPANETVARLVIVVDEFAALAQELPEFVGGLVALAARGRSLGIHLILATQRPGAAVTPEIRANTSLRIALRVTDEGESRDIVDQAGAARISRHTPGRALIRSGTEPATVVQTAWVADRPLAEPTAVSVVALEWPAMAAPPPTTTDDRTPTDLTRLVDACRIAAAAVGWRLPSSPWLPPLPDFLPLADLPTRREEADPTSMAVLLGLVDRPDTQERTPLTYHPGTGSLLVAGGQRSGRTTALRTLLAGLAGSYDADDLHVHALDCSGGALAAAVAALPHGGTAVGRDDPGRGARLLTRLVEELDIRAGRVSGGLGSITAPAAAGDPPWIVLLLDGWEAFVSVYEPVESGRPVEHLLRLCREGATVRMAAVVTSDRGGLGIRLAGALAQRIVLPLTDRADYPLAGVPNRAVPVHLPPGRAVLPGEHLEAQVAVVGDDPSGAGQQAALAALGRGLAPPRHRPPLRVAALPTVVPLDTLPPTRPRRPWLGVGGDDAAPIALDLDDLGPTLLIAGPPRSGRTTALTILARGLLGGGTTVDVVSVRRSPLPNLPGLRLVLTGGPADAARLRAVSPAVLLVDDLELLLDNPLEAAVLDLLRADTGLIVVGAGRPDDLAGAFRGLGVGLRRRRNGVLLCPSSADGELLSVRLPRGLAERRPGRGYLVVDGSLTRVQVATPGAGTPP